jgi:hypothetical protein
MPATLSFLSAFLVSFSVLLFPSLSIAQENSKTLLAEAISASNQLSQNLSIEQKLAVYEKITSIANSIISNHSGSDEAIKLLSNEPVGNFNFKAIQSSYITELTDYYDKTCEVAPSVECLAFVSLKDGREKCTKSDSFDTLNSAYNDLANAITIFNGQGSKEQYKVISVDAYRSCLPSSKLKATSVVQDYFSGKLVDAYLSIGNENAAKATIQAMTDPYRKFVGVLSLNRFRGTKIDSNYIARMEKFIKEKLKGQRQAKELATYTLKTYALQNASFKLQQKDIIKRNVGGRSLGKGDRNVCSDDFVRTYFGEVLNYYRSVAEFHHQHRTKRIGFEMSRAMDSMSGYAMAGKGTAGFLDECGEKEGGRAYGSAVIGYAIVSTISVELAENFLNYVQLNNFSRRSIQDGFFQLLEDGKKPDEYAFKKFPWSELFKFKINLLDNKVCDATKMLFSKGRGGLKDTADFGVAVDYMINDAGISMNEKYKCGDAELELLLK